MFGDLDIDRLVQLTFLLIALVASTTEPHTLHASSDTNYIDFSISKYLYDLPWNSHPIISRENINMKSTDGQLLLQDGGLGWLLMWY